MSTANRKPDEIAKDIAVTRDRLAGTVDQLVYRAHPKTIASRQVASVKAHYVDQTGRPRTDAIVKTAAIVVGVVGAIIAIRKLVG